MAYCMYESTMRIQFDIQLHINRTAFVCCEEIIALDLIEITIFS